MPKAESTEPRTCSPFVTGYARWILLLVLILLASYNVLRLLPSTVVYGARGAADFSIFYTGATILKNGLGSHLYDLGVQAQFHSPFYRAHPLPYNHLAYELLIFLPFASMPFGQAFWLWNVVNALLIAASSWIISPYLRNLFRPTEALTFFATMAFYPTMTAFAGGQDSMVLLLIFCGTYALLKSGKEAVAGLVLALGLFKFPLVLPFVVPFLLRKQWRLVGGFTLGMLCVIGVSIAITGFTGVADYFRLMNVLARYPEVGYIAPAQMPDARGFLFSLMPRWPVVQVVVAAVAATSLLALSTAKFPNGRTLEFDAWFGLNLFVAAMASPHLYRHDMTPLLLAILLGWKTALGLRVERRTMLALGVVTLVLFATPVYELVNDRGVTGYLFAVLMLGAIPIAQIAPKRKEICAKI